MAHADVPGGSLQLLQYQGLVHGFYLKFCTGWPGLLMSYVICISFGVFCSQIFMTGRLHLGEAIAGLLIFVVVLLNTQGTLKDKVKSARGILLLVITGTHAQLQNEAEIQSSTCADPNVVKISDYAFKAIAVTILAVIPTIGIAVAGRMFKNRPLASTIPAAVPETPAVPTAVIGLPIIPVVEGDDIDDVLARAPIPTRLNSPLSWLASSYYTPLETPDSLDPSTSCTMMHAGGDGSLQLLQNPGLFHIVKEQGSSDLRAICSEQYAFCARPNLMLLSYFMGIISFSIQFLQILLTGLPHGEDIAQTLLVFIIVPLILLGAQGTKHKFNSAGRQCALLLLICSLGPLIITSVRAEPQNEVEIQNCICSAPNAWVVSDDVLKALAGTILAAMTTIGVVVVGRMFRNIGPLVPEVPAIPAAVEALPIIPVIEGDDIDDVLARAPIPTRLNSPLSWL